MIRCIILLTLAALMTACATTRNGVDTRTTEMNDAQAAQGEVLRHIVLFKFKDDASEREVREVVDAFRALPEQIPQIRDLEWGTNVSPEGKAHGYTHGFTVTFDSQADLDAYLPHPAHERFKEKLGPTLDKALVFDYFAKE